MASPPKLVHVATLALLLMNLSLVMTFTLPPHPLWSATTPVVAVRSHSTSRLALTRLECDDSRRRSAKSGDFTTSAKSGDFALHIQTILGCACRRGIFECNDSRRRSEVGRLRTPHILRLRTPHQPLNLPMTIQAFCPPRPKELQRVMSTSALRATLGT